jgi:hypothetical protein
MSARTIRINRRRQVDRPFRTAQPPLDCIRWFVGNVRLRSASAWATAARRDGGYRTAHGTRRQVFFRGAPSHGGFRSRPTVGGIAWFGARTRTSCRFRECDSGQTRPKRTIMGTEGSGQRSVGRHGGACLRRAMFSTRNAAPESAATPPRCLSAWSGVPATLPPLPICTSSAVVDRVPQEHRPSRTSGSGSGGREKGTPSDSEHGSTVASTVVACGGKQIAQTNNEPR